MLQVQQICSLLVSYLCVKINWKIMEDAMVLYRLTHIHYLDSYNLHKCRAGIIVCYMVRFPCCTENFKAGAHA